MTTVITGGAGFIGSNLADALLSDGESVTILDNLSRNGVSQNLDWLKDQYSDQLQVVVADIRDPGAIEPVLAKADAVFHFAAQTAVTTSLVDPIEDFDVNARGTINVLEAVRKAGRKAPVIFSSTNKVYGGLDDLRLYELHGQHVPADELIRARGINEDRRLDFCTPYGCSKGVADQYVLDYQRSYDIPTAVLRMSCIYGPRQFGTEDQGWVAHFLIRALRGEGVTIYGDGKQVRDVLHVSDAVAAYKAALANISKVRGRAFNLGGGPKNAVSLNMVLAEIGKLVGRKVEVSHEAWREGDQLYFVAETSRLKAELGWRARVNWHDGLQDLADWLMARESAVRDQARQVQA
ncbi:NAD-dependent epimerase/dehydratase family protein [Devosia chinhatensis]|uniref:NAD-dependent epimerase/dehydratase family protein n=1 Tax=Devosia aurantiaca TaxID=2714858 RepID=A0A6M1SPL1_9HYPH|nr:NAD-dependent epimerase/dehydratase family protein [Devosia aurantiaca]